MFAEMGTLLSNILPSTCLLHFSLWTCFLSYVAARPSKTFNSGKFIIQHLEVIITILQMFFYQILKMKRVLGLECGWLQLQVLCASL